MDDRHELERELSARLRDMAPAPRADALDRASDRIVATPQHGRWRVRVLDAIVSPAWARGAAFVLVVASALLVGVVIGEVGGPLTQGSDPSASASSAPSATASQGVAWEEPASYSFVITDQGCGGGERDHLGLMRVYVEDGETLEYVALDEAAQRYTGTLDEIPTLAGLLALADEALRTSDPAVPIVDLRTDPVDGHPVRIHIDWVPEGGDDDECYVVSEFLPGTATPGWTEPDRYTFEFEASCGLRVLHGRFRADVVNGVTQEYERLDQIQLPLPLEPADVPTLGEMLRRAAEATASGESEVTVERDPVDGHPTLVDIDWIVNAIDDEECYEILEYEPAAPDSSVAPSGDPTEHTVMVAPSSAPGAEIGVAYSFGMGHCGLLSPIDFDGSLWDPLNQEYSVVFDGATGTILLTSVDRARFVSDAGDELELARVEGSAPYPLCR
jgi:hypothetical protein